MACLSTLTLSAVAAAAPLCLSSSTPSCAKPTSVSVLCPPPPACKSTNLKPQKAGDSLALTGIGIGSSSSSRRRGPEVICAVGDVSAEGTNYLILGAVVIALLGTAFPILFSRKDLCPECDGAGFIRKPGAALSANAARKDVAQIVCPRCNGLGKLGQVDK
ncbi:hypothetical protein O6H91_07G016200 [Diphasiastrum complanatum]|uniref:Uncharacterized protein n=1 Tax=Diphasiastrum complanatum TaxID=34168 RepID=A0ACC2D349_DIPCM|nr:hypothetical protein O6H91_07G016200 [Diphasiastrum complanatum]